MWARLRASGSEEALGPGPGTNARRPPRRGRCARAPRGGGRGSGGSGTRAHSEGPRACVAAAAGNPRLCKPPGARGRNPRAARPSAGLLRIPGRLAVARGARPPERGAPGARGGARSPRPGRRAGKRRQLPPGSPRSPRTQTPRQPPGSTPFPASPAPLAALFQNPGRSCSPRSREGGERGSGAGAMKKPPNLPTVSPTPGSCADGTAQAQDGLKSEKAPRRSPPRAAQTKADRAAENAAGPRPAIPRRRPAGPARPSRRRRECPSASAPGDFSVCSMRD